MRLSDQDKLALALTSAGSMRNLAALVGVSHQRIGRWLREGEAGGVKAIPEQFRESIDTAYKIHRDIAREQAAIDNTPYNPKAPVFFNRNILNTGEPSDRISVQHTQFIKPELRKTVLVETQKTGRVLNASIRSIVNIRLYFKNKFEKEAQQGKRQFKGIPAAVNSAVSAFADKHRELDIEPDEDDEDENEDEDEDDEDDTRALFTPYENLSPQADPDLAARGIEKKLREKHEPATGVKGSTLADEFLFQMIPQGYVKQTSGKTASNRGKSRGKPRAKSRKHVRGRGNK